MYNQYTVGSPWPVPVLNGLRISDVPKISTSCVCADLDDYAKNVLFEGSVGTHRAVDCVRQDCNPAMCEYTGNRH